MKTDGTRGRDGTEDRRLCVETGPGGAGKVVGSSHRMSYSSYHSVIASNLFALVGGGGSGGRCVGLPGLDIKIDFRTTIDDPDLLRLCLGEGSLGNNALCFSMSVCMVEDDE